jgi:uncharacterized protein (TIGR03086 family)
MGAVRAPDALIDALELQGSVAERVPADAVDDRSQCDSWTIGEVLNHSIGVTRKFTAFASGVTDRPHAPPGDLLGDDHHRALRDTIDAAREAWAAADMSRTCHLGFGAFPADAAAGINLFDVLAHTWDIAAAIDADLDPTSGLWVVGLHAAQAAIGPVRDPNHYGPEIPVSSSAVPLVRFLALLGRSHHSA